MAPCPPLLVIDTVGGDPAMPRTVDFSVESSASVEEIRWAFSEESYWLARMAAFGGFGKLDSLIIGPEGSVTVALVHDLAPDGLPRPFAKFFPRNWQVVQDETWGPIDDGLVRGEVGITAHGAPGSGRGTALRPASGFTVCRQSS